MVRNPKRHFVLSCFLAKRVTDRATGYRKLAKPTLSFLIVFILASNLEWAIGQRTPRIVLDPAHPELTLAGMSGSFGSMSASELIAASEISTGKMRNMTKYTHQTCTVQSKMRTLTRYFIFLAKTGNSESLLQISTDYTCLLLHMTRRSGHCILFGQRAIKLNDAAGWTQIQGMYRHVKIPCVSQLPNPEEMPCGPMSKEWYLIFFIFVFGCDKISAKESENMLPSSASGLPVRTFERSWLKIWITSEV